MNREQVKQLLPLLTAFAEGKELQYRINSGTWQPCTVSPDLEKDHSTIEYRIKPEPVVVKYRRYLSNINGDHRVYTYQQGSTGIPHTSPCFVRWIDNAWQEEVL